jgi:hypothetical protein
MSAALLDQLLASPSPFIDVFDGELLPCGPTIDLEARCIGWQPLGLLNTAQTAQAQRLPCSAAPNDIDDAPCIDTPSNTWKVLTSIGNVISEHTDQASAEGSFNTHRGKVLLVSPENRIVARQYKPANG